MTYRKIINRMEKAKKRHGQAMERISSACGIGRGLPFEQIDVEIYNIGVEAYNEHVAIWNKLARYVTSLRGKRK